MSKNTYWRVVQNEVYDRDEHGRPPFNLKQLWKMDYIHPVDAERAFDEMKEEGVEIRFEEVRHIDDETYFVCLARKTYYNEEQQVKHLQRIKEHRNFQRARERQEA